MYINSMELFNVVHVVQKYYIAIVLVYYIVKVLILKNILAINESTSANVNYLFFNPL